MSPSPRRPLLRALPGAALALAALAAAQGGIAFRDNAGNMELRNFRSFSSEQQADGSLRFSGAGSPLQGTWRRQGLAVSGSRIEGTARRSGRAFLLSQATLTGSVRAESTGGGSRVETTASAATIRTGGAATQLDCRGPVTTVATRADGARLEARGAQAQLSLANGTLQRGTLAGSVRVVLTRGAERLEATANRGEMTLTGNRTLVLSGNVKLVGSGDAYTGEASVGRAVVRLDANLNPTGVQLTP